MTPASRVRVVVAVTVLVAALVWPCAILAKSTGGHSPQYPGSRLAVSMSKKARAGSVVKVTFSGRNAAFTQGAPITYGLSAFVQSRADLPRCPASYGEELNNFANLGGRSIIRIATNLNEGVQGRFRFSVRYQAGSVRRIVVCAYSRLITDDAAYAQLRTTLRRPRRR